MRRVVGLTRALWAPRSLLTTFEYGNGYLFHVRRPPYPSAVIAEDDNALDLYISLDDRWLLLCSPYSCQPRRRSADGRRRHRRSDLHYTHFAFRNNSRIFNSLLFYEV